MDMDKSKTDLRDAGRRKLQQFRQNKKGNKSSGKSSKTQSDAVLGAETAEKHPDNGAVSASVESCSSKDVPPVDNDGTDVHQSSKDSVTESISSEAFAQLHNHGLREAELDGNVADKVDSMNILHERETSEAERQKGEEQVTDVGPMQKGDNSAEQGDNRNETSLDKLASAEVNVVKTEENADISSTVSAVCAESLDVGDHSVSGQCSSKLEGAINVTSRVQDEEVYGDSGSSAETDQVDRGGREVDAAGSVLGGKVDDSVASQSLGCISLTLSSGSGDFSISLSQLAEVIQRLDESAFSYLIESRHLPMKSLPIKPIIYATDIATVEAFEKLKEHLYLASCTKDALQLERAEQLEEDIVLQQKLQNLAGELSVSSSSLVEAQGRNEIISQDFALCRSELLKLVSEKEELENQLHRSKSEIEERGSVVNELRSKLDMSQENLVKLEAELASSSNVELSLLSEIEMLNGRLSLLTEENVDVLNDNKRVVSELAQYKASLTSLQLENEILTKNITLLTEEKSHFDAEKKCASHEKDKLLSDLTDCNGMVEALQVEISNLNEVLAAVKLDKKHLEEANEHLVSENASLAAEAMAGRGSMEALQIEFSSMHERLNTLTDEINMVQDERDCLLSNNQSQSHELVENKAVISGLQADIEKAMANTRDASILIEKLTQENVLLRTNLELYIAEIHQVEHTCNGNYHVSDLSCHTPWNRESETAVALLEKSSLAISVLDRPVSQRFQPSDLEGLLEFDSWRRCLDDAWEVFQKLEKAFEGLHSDTNSSGRTGKPVAPAVSKLIQAFESKDHTDEEEISCLPSSEYLSTSDPYMMTKEQMKHLKTVLGLLFSQMEDTCKCFVAEKRNRVFAEGRVAELHSSYEYLSSHSGFLEGENIEHIVLLEALRQHTYSSAATLNEVVALCEASQKQHYYLTVENSQLRERVSCFSAKISEFQAHLSEICQSSDEMVSSVSNQVEILLKEVAETGSVLDDEWNAFVAQIVEAVRKLEVSFEPLRSSELSDGLCSSNNVGESLVASIDGAKGAVEVLHEELKAVRIDREVTLSDYSELDKHFTILKAENEKAMGMLRKIYRNLWQFVTISCGSTEGINTDLEHEQLPDPLDYGVFDLIMEKLGSIAHDKIFLESTTNNLRSELVDYKREIDELKRRSLDSDTILRLCEDAERAFKLDSFDVQAFEPQSCLASLINILIQKYKEAEQQINLSTEMSPLTEMHANGLPGELDGLSLLIIGLDTENTALKESWKIVNDNSHALSMQLLEKISELEQSEQRVSSLRDKLGMAVMKGKGLVAQRDSLKQSLAESSSQLEQYSQELHTKDVRIHELEIKLKNYSEAGHRMEALESELSYIRNSATALRESFLLKDSVLQRIEEILEDLELPEHFHSGGLIEKVDWLAKSVTHNTIPVTEWDQKSGFGGGSLSDSGLAVTDDWKEETVSRQNSVDELRRRYDELQSKFYGLAEQNEMLEQSLMESNNLVQRWESISEKINVPSQLRLSEPEDQFQWLGTALSEAQDSSISLQQRVDYLERLCESLNGDLEESRKRLGEEELACQSITSEKESLLKDLETLGIQYSQILKKTTRLESDNESLLREISLLEKKLDKEQENAERIRQLDGALIRLQDEIKVALQYSDIVDLDFGSDSAECLERMLRKLIEEYKTFALLKPAIVEAGDVQVAEEGCVIHSEGSSKDSFSDGVKDVAELRKNLEDSLSELMYLKEERERYKEQNQALICELEELDLKKKELLELLNQEEQKSASWREKLNIAVKRGKSLVEQRDNLKKNIEEINSEILHLKSQLSSRDATIADYELSINNLSIKLEKSEAAKSECQLLKDRLIETELLLHEREHMLSMILNALKDINIRVDFSSENPVEKLQAIEAHCHELEAAVDLKDKDLKKSRGAADLLLAELNEVQERNDNLQEELANVIRNHAEISREILLSEAAKSQALAELQKISAVLSKEKEDHVAEVTSLKSYTDQLKEDFSAINELVSDLLTNNMDIMCNLEGLAKLCLEPALSPHTDVARFSIPGSTISSKFRNKTFLTELSPLKERLCSHDNLFYAKASHIAEIVYKVHREVASIQQASGAKESHLVQLETMMREKDSELFALRRNSFLLYDACNISVMEIEKWKSQQSLASRSKNLSSVDDGRSYDGEIHVASEDDVRAVRDKLIMLVKDLIRMQSEIASDSHNEMKTVILNLQKELHEKDIQRERISMELVNQIKESEAAARNYLQDLQSAKAQVEALSSQVALLGEERKALENRVKELRSMETTFIELQQKLSSLTDALVAKEQENEALMQALDEEESQMEDMSMKIGELEKALEQKDKDLENLEASRGKALKKLSITVRKFDELHKLSESLLSEVEKLQSQLQERDGEISFLRQEVTRCTNESLTATQIINKKNSEEIHELLAWLDIMISRVTGHDLPSTDAKTNQVDDHKQFLEKQMNYIVSELEELRAVAENKGVLLEVERVKVQELSQKMEFLESLLHDKESQLAAQKGLGDPGQGTRTGSEIMEVEPLINKRAASGSIATQVRGVHKGNSDQFAIAIDMDPSALDEEDDDKAHGFKSLTTSRIVPRFTRPVSDMIDGLWVSCDRALMRQPALRLGMIMYWAMIHALLAAFVV